MLDILGALTLVHVKDDTDNTAGTAQSGPAVVRPLRRNSLLVYGSSEVRRWCKKHRCIYFYSGKKAGFSQDLALIALKTSPARNTVGGL